MNDEWKSKKLEAIAEESGSATETHLLQHLNG
jgi:hypothetical protein